MSQITIAAKGLSKSFSVEKSGILETVRYFFALQKQKIIVLENLSFSIKKGERIALIGPSSSGKSTLLKILSGILLPTQGELRVCLQDPRKDRIALNKKLSLFIGGKSQLSFSVSVSESLELFRLLYALPKDLYQNRLQELLLLCNQGQDLYTKAGDLPLIKRVLFDLVLSLLHKPEILLLDDPMIGLETKEKEIIKSFLQEICSRWHIALLLATKQTDDIAPLCQRVFLLNNGSLLKNTSIKEWKKIHSKKGILSLLIKEPQITLTLPGVKILENASYKLRCEVNLEEISIEQLLAKVLQKTPVQSMSFESLSIEKIIQTTKENATSISL